MEKKQPRAVRVWLGYALPHLLKGKGRARFYQQLGSVFIPATVKLMAPLGLRAYIPTILDCTPHAMVPDEIALVFYRGEEDYRRACHESCAGRAYGALHGSIFSFEIRDGRPASHSAFPTLFNGKPEQSGAIELFDLAADWQRGEVISEMVVRTDLSVRAFRQDILTMMAALKLRSPVFLESVYYYLSDDLLVCWSSWQKNSQPLLSQKLGDIVLSSRAQPASVPASVFSVDPGLTVAAGESLNLQFDKDR